MLSRRALGVLVLVPVTARAQSSGGALFMPAHGQENAAPGRSLERLRDPAAWGIDDAQWRRFQAAARASGAQVRVVVRLNNLRARQFKADLVELLASIPGWEVEDQGDYTAGSLPPVDGILIQNISAIEPSDGALTIKRALDEAGIKPEATFDPTQPTRIRIVVGAPPDR